MKILLSIVLFLSISTTALAWPDESPDVMGFFLDSNFPIEEGVAPVNIPFLVYAVLMNPTQPALDAFEFGYDHEVPPGMESLVFRLATNWPPGYIWIHPVYDVLQGTIVLELASPMPTSEYTVLMSWQFMLLSDLVVGFHMTGANPSSFPGDLPGYGLDQELVACGIAETCFGTGAYVNAWCPLSVETQSWGTLKGLYR